MVPRARIELATQGFSVLRSTTELPRRMSGNGLKNSKTPLKLQALFLEKKKRREASKKAKQISTRRYPDQDSEHFVPVRKMTKAAEACHACSSMAA